MSDTETVMEVDKIRTSILKDPGVLASLQSKLNSMVGQSSGYVASLPSPVRRRIKALKKLQLEKIELETKFYEESRALERKYAQLYAHLHKKRALITSGEYEPTDIETELPLGDQGAQKKEIMEKVSEHIMEKKDTVGVPGFWLTIFQNSPQIAEMIQELDEPALKTLTDVTVTLNEEPSMGFTLHFHFTKNDFFTNSILTKQYEMNCELDKEDPLSFEGPSIVKCTGCKIDWLPGMNQTVREVIKRQKHKKSGIVRIVKTEEKTESFFNFFSPPVLPEDPDSFVPVSTQDILTADFEIGHYIREMIIPRAVLYFTGEATENEGEPDSEEDEEEEDESDKDPDFDPKKVPTNPDCKQQ